MEIIVILDNIRSALNVGAIFRTCDGAGVNKIILSGITPHPPHPKVLKTSLGANEYVDFEVEKDLIKTVEHLKKNEFRVYSIEENKIATDFFESNFRSEEKVVFIFGNEIFGVSKELQELSDEILFLPMIGKKRSLNVSTTAGIVLYNAKFAK